MTPYQKLLLVRILRLLTKLLMTFKIGNPGCPCCSRSTSSSLSSSYSSSNPSSSLSSSTSSSESASLSSSSESISESLSESISSSSSEDVDCFCGEFLNGQAYMKFVVSGGEDTSRSEPTRSFSVCNGEFVSGLYNFTEWTGWAELNGTYLLKLESADCSYPPTIPGPFDASRKFIPLGTTHHKRYLDETLMCDEPSLRSIEIFMSDPLQFGINGGSPINGGRIDRPNCDPETPWQSLTGTQTFLMTVANGINITIEASYVIL